MNVTVPTQVGGLMGHWIMTWIEDNDTITIFDSLHQNNHKKALKLRANLAHPNMVQGDTKIIDAKVEPKQGNWMD